MEKIGCAPELSRFGFALFFSFSAVKNSLPWRTPPCVGNSPCSNATFGGQNGMIAIVVFDRFAHNLAGLEIGIARRSARGGHFAASPVFPTILAEIIPTETAGPSPDGFAVRKLIHIEQF